MAVRSNTALPQGAETCDGVTITAERLAAETSAEIGRASRVLEVARRKVLDYAPSAPGELLDEAVIRFGGYLLGSDYGAVRSEALGPKSAEYVTNHAAAFRNSGAAALLSAYKKRRAGSIG